MNKKILILAAAAAVALTACGPREQEDESASPEPSPVIRTTPDIQPTPPPAETPEGGAETVPPTPEAEESPAPEATPAATEQPTAEQTDESAQPQVSDEPAPAVESPGPSEADPLSTPEVSRERGKGVPTDEEVLSKYREANEAYSWFAICTLTGDAEDSRTVDDFLYTRVSDPRFPTMNSLRAYLKTLFSDEIVDNLLPYDGRQYMDIDGALYVSEGARGADTSKGGVTLMVVWPEGAEPLSCTVKATVELLDWPEDSEEPVVAGEGIYEFPYQKVGDKWVFTQFESIF